MAAQLLLSENGIAGAPATLQAALNGMPVSFGFLGPLDKWFGLVANCQNAIAAAVARLLFSGCPPQVPGNIAFVVIDSVKRMLWGWALADRLKEGRKGCSPQFMHFDAAPSVVAVSGVVGVGTALNDLRPRSVYRALPHAVRGQDLSRSLFLDTPAASCGLLCEVQIVGPNDKSVSAIAYAGPVNAVAPTVQFDDKDAPKTLACEIGKRAHCTSLVVGEEHCAPQQVEN